uniref:X-box-binding protein 1 n=1 Tax=Eptatretus burgeri TaxID=7764 RepID=A0A8C4PXL8_EPTBU
MVAVLANGAVRQGPLPTASGLQLPKCGFIIASNVLRSASPGEVSSSDDDDGACSGSTSERDSSRPVHKRQRLSHLTIEEKVLRRKLKNRVAAQTARDRKKDRMTKLEQQVERLLAQNRQLADENRQLKERAACLLSANAHLQQRLANEEGKANLSQEVGSGNTDSCRLLESAELEHCAPLQQRQAWTTVFLTCHLHWSLLVTLLWLSWTFWILSSKPLLHPIGHSHRHLTPLPPKVATRSQVRRMNCAKIRKVRWAYRPPP